MNFFISILAWLLRLGLSLRYKVTIKGFDSIKRQLPLRGCIFISNHTSLIDPVLLFAWFWPALKVRPLVAEFVSYIPKIGRFLSLLKPVLIPNFLSSINQYKLQKTQKALNEVVEGIQSGDNFLIFPAGRLKFTSKESLKGTVVIHQIISEKPDTDLLLCRISGLWGSQFSRAISRTPPNLTSVLFKGIKILFKNLIFFAPRRKIHIDLELNPKDFPRKGKKTEINSFCQDWYNQYVDEEGKVRKEEPLQLVPYFFWSKETATLPKPFQREKKKGLQVHEVEERIFQQIRKILDQPHLDVKPEDDLGEDLGMDSLARSEVIAYLIRHFKVSKADFMSLHTVGDLIELALNPEDLNQEAPKPSTITFFQKENRPLAENITADTLLMALLDTVKRFGPYEAIADNLTEPLSYRKVKQAVLILALEFQKLPGTHVAVLLPSSVGCLLVILALLFAGKVPALLNWTLGPRPLEQMVALSKAEVVLSSWRFLENVSFVDFGTVSEKIQLMEQIRNKISLKDKIKGMLLSFRSSKAILKKTRDRSYPRR